MAGSLAPPPHELDPRGLRVLALPPGDSTFTVTGGHPVIAVNLAAMDCRMAFGGARMAQREVARGASCWLPPDVEFRMAGYSLAWSILLEIGSDLAAALGPEVEIADPLDFAVAAPMVPAAESAIRELIKPEPDPDRVGEAGFALLATTLARTGRTAVAPTRVRRDDRRIGTAVDRIMQDLQDVPSVHELASLSGLSATHFTRLFRAVTGRSVWDFVRRARCREARRLLMVDPMPVAEVAVACGFHDQAHLTKAFREATGTTPAAFRRDVLG